MPRIIIDFEWPDEETEDACLDRYGELDSLLSEALDDSCVDFGIRPDSISYDD